MARGCGFGEYDRQLTRCMGDFDRRLLRKPGERSFPRKPLLIRSPPVSDSISGSVVSFRGIDDGDEDDDKLGVDDFLKEKSDMSALVGCFFSLINLLRLWGLDANSFQAIVRLTMLFLSKFWSGLYQKSEDERYFSSYPLVAHKTIVNSSLMIPFTPNAQEGPTRNRSKHALVTGRCAVFSSTAINRPLTSRKKFCAW